jgi:tetratricopeptide (TPR) repeat protein
MLYGQTALASSQNLDLALLRFNKCLTLTPPPKATGPAYVYWRIGQLQEKRGDKPAARAAYEASLQADPNFSKASEALERLK